MQKAHQRQLANADTSQSKKGVILLPESLSDPNTKPEAKNVCSRSPCKATSEGQPCQPESPLQPATDIGVNWLVFHHLWMSSHARRTILHACSNGICGMSTP
jgi:hypothetical protein